MENINNQKTLSMIKIVYNNIELKVVRETLTLTTKNTAFSDSFSLDYSQHPFLIIEDSNTVKALGSRHILSLNKLKEYEVTVFKDNKVYFGKLKVRSYVVGARKCDLVFGSELIKILDKPIANFMPTIYFGDQVPYSESTNVEFPQQPIVDALAIHETKSYPEVDFQFPEIYAPNFYDKEDSTFANYIDYLNHRDLGKLKENVITQPETNLLIAENYSLFHPFIFLLSLIKYAFQNVDYNFKGSFIDANFTHSILIASKFNNNTERTIEYVGESYQLVNDFSQAADNGYVLFEKKLSDLGMGEHGIQVDFTNIPQPVNATSNLQITARLYPGSGFNSIRIFTIQPFFSGGYDNGFFSIKKSGKFEVDSSNYDWKLEVFLFHSEQGFPQSHNILIFPWYEKPKQYQIHPTLNLSRFSPKWTVNETLTNIKNIFNLKLDFDDSLKIVSLDFIDEYLNSSDMVDLSNYKLEIKSYDNNQSDVFKISYANNEFVRIDKNGVSEEPVIENDAVEIDNEFLTLPFNGTHHELNKEDLDTGVVLVFNNSGVPNTTNEIDGQTLNLAGEKGIANKQWRDWVKFRQNASLVELVGKLPKHIIMKIEQKKKIFYDNIVFLVEDLTTRENNGFTEVTLKVQSKTF